MQIDIREISEMLEIDLQPVLSPSDQQDSGENEPSR
jgi:hypothetical protein